MNYINTNITNVRFKKTTKEDAKIILELIKELATYEKMIEDVVATEERLIESIYEKHQAEALLIEYKEEVIGYIIYYYNFSTFVGRAGLYLEDVYIRPKYRGKGIGREVFNVLAKIAKEEKCERFEWVCLDWNKPSLKFYSYLGAKAQKQWVIHRLDKDGIEKISEE